MFQQNLLDQNSSSLNEEKLSKALMLNTRKKKNDHISFLVTQCFGGLDSFGMNLKDAVKLHCDVLVSLDMDDVTKAFRQWLKENTVVPKPADILRMVEEMQPEKKTAMRAQAMTPPLWEQKILDYETDLELECRPSGTHLPPAAIYSKYGNRRVYTRMAREN